MALLRRIQAARGAAETAARLAAVGAVLAAAPAVATAGLLAEPARATARVARAAAGAAAGAGAAVADGSLHLARVAAVPVTRAVGTLLTGADPIPDGHLHSLVDAAKG